MFGSVSSRLPSMGQHRRPVSMIILPTLQKDGTTTSSTSRSNSMKRKARMSISSISSRLFRRSTLSENDLPCQWSEGWADPPEPRKSSSTFSRRSRLSQDDRLWIMRKPASPVYSHTDYLSFIHDLKEDECHSPIDPFSSSPSTESIYISLSDPAPIEQSFLSFTPSDVSAPHPLPTRPRPVSVQTMPLPARRSSETLDSDDPCLRSEATDDWMYEQFIPIIMASEHVEKPECEIDWRQFHLDWLSNAPSLPTSPID